MAAKKKPETDEPTGTRDAMDAGVPMPVGEPHEGPEDALDPNARGDYSDRMESGPSMTTVIDDDGNHRLVPTADVMAEEAKVLKAEKAKAEKAKAD